MSIRIQCVCGELIDARERLAGREVRCPRCQRLVLVPGHTGQVSPVTAFGVAVLVGIAVTLGLLLLPGWLAEVRHGPAARSAVCAGNLRALWLAIHAYAADHDGWMPSSWDNTFALIAPYLSEHDRTGPGAVWRCPADIFQGTDPANHCSYGVNADETDGGPDNDNRFYPPARPGDPPGLFRQSGVASDDGRTDVYPGPFAHRVREGQSRQAGVRLSQLAPNTILLVELWSPYNTLDLDQPRQPNRGGPEPRDRLSLAIREYAAWRRPKFDDRGHLIDAGSYLFLRPYEARGIPLAHMYHAGRVNVLRANGQVDLVPITAFLEPAPKGFAPRAGAFTFDGTPWTRFKD